MTTAPVVGTASFADTDNSVGISIIGGYDSVQGTHNHTTPSLPAAGSMLRNESIRCHVQRVVLSWLDPREGHLTETSR